MTGPTDEQINTFFEFTGSSSRDVAISFIKGNNGNFENAVSEYFNDPSPKRYENNVTWDDSAFAMDREGGVGEANAGAVVPYVNVQDSRPQFGPHMAPSRPPSRAAHTQSTSAWSSSGSNFEGEDEAMKRSMLDMSSGQETGVINARGHEYVPDAEPGQRVRQAGEPACLKPLPNHDFLPALVTILHSVPAVREPLRFSHHVSHDYGDNERWWEGESIATSRVRDLSVHGDNMLDSEDVIMETQRLMAFLDGTTRSYGSAAALARCLNQDPTYTAPWSDGPQFGEVLSCWDRLLTDKLFTSKLCRGDATAQAGQRELPRVHLDVDVVHGVDGEQATLYDAVNAALWGSQVISATSRDDWLSETAPVAVMRVQQPWQTYGAPKKMQVPRHFFADRYTAARASYIKSVAQQMQQDNESLHTVKRKLARLETFPVDRFAAASTAAATTASSNRGSVQKLMETIVGFLKSPAGNEDDDTGLAEVSANLVAQLEAISAGIEDRIGALYLEREAARQALRRLSTVLTSSEAEQDEQRPELGYKLCGVATMRLNQPAVTYIRVREEDTDNDDDDDDDDDEGDDDKDRDKDRDKDGEKEYQSGGSDESTTKGLWWKISYETAGSSANVNKYRVSEAIVLEAAGSCTADTLLVYVSDKLAGLADSDHHQEQQQQQQQQQQEARRLPDSLRAFVDKDNARFASELRGQRNQISELPPYTADEQMTHAHGDQTDETRRMSNDSTTVLGGDSPRVEDRMLSAEEEMRAFNRHDHDEQ